ncbi:MAG: ThuA domain-containing protein [Planctomycetota bacterium]
MKQALFLIGGWDGHKPRETAEPFARFLETKGFSVERAETLAILADEARMRQFDLVVPCWTMGAIAKNEEAGLLAAVKAGTGLAGWHGGMADAFRQNTDYQFMVGGQWVAHPGGEIPHDYRIARPEDPIVAGLGGFHLVSEQYYMHVDPSNEVLVETVFTGEHAPWIAGCVMPAAWKRRFGTGRVFYASFGHKPEDFAVPGTAEIMRRGMLWAAR